MLTYHLTLKVRNTPGVLVRIAHVFARRNCNIRSLHVEPSPMVQWSTMTIAAQNVPGVDQIVLQLEKLVDVYKVTVYKGENHG